MAQQAKQEFAMVVKNSGSVKHKHSYQEENKEDQQSMKSYKTFEHNKNDSPLASIMSQSVQTANFRALSPQVSIDMGPDNLPNYNGSFVQSVLSQGNNTEHSVNNSISLHGQS